MQGNLMVYESYPIFKSMRYSGNLFIIISPLITFLTLFHFISYKTCWSRLYDKMCVMNNALKLRSRLVIRCHKNELIRESAYQNQRLSGFHRDSWLEFSGKLNFSFQKIQSTFSTKGQNYLHISRMKLEISRYEK